MNANIFGVGAPNPWQIRCADSIEKTKEDFAALPPRLIGNGCADCDRGTPSRTSELDPRSFPLGSLDTIRSVSIAVRPSHAVHGGNSRSEPLVIATRLSSIYLCRVAYYLQYSLLRRKCNGDVIPARRGTHPIRGAIMNNSLLRPFRAPTVFCVPVPRAMPWADM